MGSLKENLLTERESRQIGLSEELGISWEELELLDYHVDANLSKDGFVYGYVINFSESCDAEILSKIDNLTDDRRVRVSPWVFERTYDEEYELRAISEKSDPKESFVIEVQATRKLQRVNIEDVVVRGILLRQIFVTTIAALEAYLSEIFINKTLSEQYLLERFVKNHPEFKKQKISVSDIHATMRDIKERAKTLMLSTTYHNLPVVREMFIQTFYIDFPDIMPMQEHIRTRHDLVHRNGKTKEGKSVVVDDRLIAQLQSESIKFVSELDHNLKSDDIPF